MKIALYEVVVVGEVRYVGITSNPRARANNHRQTGVMCEHSEMRVVRWYKTRDQAAQAERRRIFKLKPALNAQVWRTSAQVARARQAPAAARAKRLAYHVGEMYKILVSYEAEHG